LFEIIFILKYNRRISLHLPTFVYSSWMQPVNFLTGFMFFKSLMKGREVVEGVWQATIGGGEKLILMSLLLMKAL